MSKARCASPPDKRRRNSRGVASSTVPSVGSSKRLSKRRNDDLYYQLRLDRQRRESLRLPPEREYRRPACRRRHGTDVWLRASALAPAATRGVLAVSPNNQRGGGGGCLGFGPNARPVSRCGRFPLDRAS